MNGLIKIDVAAALFGNRKSVSQLFEMAEGGSLTEKALLWVFDLSNGEVRRDLRFWAPEIEARVSADASKHNKYCGWELDWVIAKIVPVTINEYRAGQVDLMFQIRPRTRIDFGEELNGNKRNGANTYQRENLVKFLTTRWLGQRVAAK